MGKFVGKTTPGFMTQEVSPVKGNPADENSRQQDPQTDKKDQQPPHIKALFDFFLTRYEPARPGPEILRKTTMEIFEELQAHCPSPNYSPEFVYQFLVENNFSYETPGGDVHFLWQLKYRHPSPFQSA